eukprot:198842-Rhodomonas_salina.1
MRPASCSLLLQTGGAACGVGRARLGKCEGGEGIRRGGLTVGFVGRRSWGLRTRVRVIQELKVQRRKGSETYVKSRRST